MAACEIGFDATGVGGWCITHRRWQCPGDQEQDVKQHSEKELARAKRVRDKRLARKTALYGACVCMWPIISYRNRSGHDGTCPAHALFMKFKEEDEDARAELDT
jgi:hypothetical protein